jgi:predicted DNA-binding transcriptional regulator AlpA
MNARTPPPDEVVRQPEISRIVGLCDMSLRRMEKAGAFPKRFKLNALSGPYGGVGWSRVEVMAWIAERKAGGRQAA